MAFKICESMNVLKLARVSGALPKCLGALIPTTPPRMQQHIVVDATSAVSTALKTEAVEPIGLSSIGIFHRASGFASIAPKLEVGKPTSSIDIGYRAYSSGFFTLNPNTMILYVEALYKMLDSAYGAEILEMITLVWKYTPAMLIVDRALSAGEMKVGSAKMAEMNEKIEKLPEVTVKQLILQMDRFGLKEILKVTGLDKKKAEFEKNMSEFEKNRLELENKLEFEKYMSAFEKRVSKFELDGNKFEEPYAETILISSTRQKLFRKKLSAAGIDNTDGEELYIELDPHDIDVAELTKSLGVQTIIIIPIRGKLVRKKFGASSIGNIDSEDVNECKNVDDDVPVKKEDKDDAEEGRKATYLDKDDAEEGRKATYLSKDASCKQ